MQDMEKQQVEIEARKADASSEGGNHASGSTVPESESKEAEGWPNE